MRASRPPSVHTPLIRLPTRPSSCAATDRRVARLRPQQRTHAEDLNSLTRRELEISRLVAGGLGPKEIADRLVLSNETKYRPTSAMSCANSASVTEHKPWSRAYESGLVVPRAYTVLRIASGARRPQRSPARRWLAPRSPLHPATPSSSKGGDLSSPGARCAGPRRRTARCAGDGVTLLLVAGANRSAPPGPVISELAYPDVSAAVDWLVKVSQVSSAHPDRHGHRAQLSFGSGSLIVADVGYGRVAPTGEEASQSVMLRVEDVASLCDRVRRNGGTILREPQDFQYGERQCTFLDPAGHRWTLTETLRDVAPEDWGGVAIDDP